MDGENDYESDATTGQKRKVQNRTARACVACNRSKLKCDGGQPCSRCVVANTIQDCSYPPSMRGKTRRKNNALPENSQDIPPTRQRQPSTSSSWYPESNTSRQQPTTRQQESPRQLEQMPNIATAFRSRTLRNSELVSNSGALTTLPLPGDAHNPLAVLAEATAGLQNSPNAIENDDRNTYSSNAGMNRTDSAKDIDYYASLPTASTTRTLQAEAPHIMRLISPAEAEALFEAYWKFIHPHLPCLDKEHSGTIDVASRSNFLFNAICCTTARSFNVSLWEKLKDFAKAEMTRFPLEKNMDVVQGHLIYSEWNLAPSKRFEQDMTWLRVGMAVRTAIDINLHRVALLNNAQSTLPSWLIGSMVRTWLLAYSVDRTLSAQLGKPATMRGDNTVRKCLVLLQSGLSEPSTTPEEAMRRLQDGAVAALTEWNQALSSALDVFRVDGGHESSSSNLGTHNAYPDLVFVFQKQFNEWRDKWVAQVESMVDVGRTKDLVHSRLLMYHNYAQLVIASFGLQRAVSFNPVELPSSLARFRHSAIRVVDCFETSFENKGLTRGCPDFVFTCLTYAVVSLIKSTQDRFASVNGGSNEAIFDRCRAAANMLSSAANTPDHLPAFQSTFLTRLLDIRTAEAYTPRAIVPEMVDLQALANSITANPSQSYWPPSAHASPQRNPFTSFPTQTDDLWGLPLDSSHLGSLFSQQPSGSSSSGFLNASAVPEMPAASFGPSVGTFDHNNDDMLMFTNDSFWKSILETHP